MDARTFIRSGSTLPPRALRLPSAFPARFSGAYEALTALSLPWVTANALLHCAFKRPGDATVIPITPMGDAVPIGLKLGDFDEESTKAWEAIGGELPRSGGPT